MKQTKHKHLDTLSQILSYSAIGTLVFLAIGLQNIDNYFDWIYFSITTLIAGLLFGYILYSILCLFIPEAKKYRNAKGVGFLAPLVFSFSLIFFGTGSIINESSYQRKECREYTIQNMGESGSRQRTYYIFITNDNSKVERLSFGNAFNKNHEVGDKVNLCIITGILGFKYYEINTSV